jgi:cytochrome c oxidase cbb3-type subunit II
MRDPRDLVPESIMPAYPWLETTRLDTSMIQATMRAHRVAGTPYTDEMIDNARRDLLAQWNPDGGDVDALLARYPKAEARNFTGSTEVTELDAVIAYLQMLGTLVDFSTYEPDPAR